MRFGTRVDMIITDVIVAEITLNADVYDEKVQYDVNGMVTVVELFAKVSATNETTSGR